jgi:hypothetical protein
MSNLNNKKGGDLAIKRSDLLDKFKALKVLGMRCVVMDKDRRAFACEFMLRINDNGTGWRQQEGYNPFARYLNPEILDGYADKWEDSLIDLNSLPSNGLLLGRGVFDV